MIEAIEDELARIEEAEGVRVLLAVEAGSRAWGTASRDSDYDVRFVYARRVRDYLALARLNGTCDDVIEWKLEGDLDISGWDLTKFLALLRRTNPGALEWLGSPIVYREEPRFCAVRKLAPACFSQAASAFHYLSKADHNLKPLAGDGPVQLKTYLNLVHALLSARWSLEHEVAAPVQIAHLIEAHLEPAMRPLVESAVHRKVQRASKDQLERIPEIDRWALAARDDVAARAKAAPKAYPLDWEEFDDVFLSIVE